MPSGLLPVLELDGRVVTESAVIMSLLEEAFPETKALMPAKGSPERARADQLMRLERRFFSDWLQWLTNSYNHEGGRRRGQGEGSGRGGEGGTAAAAGCWPEGARAGRRGC